MEKKPPVTRKHAYFSDTQALCKEKAPISIDNARLAKNMPPLIPCGGKAPYARASSALLLPRHAGQAPVLAIRSAHRGRAATYKSPSVISRYPQPGAGLASSPVRCPRTPSSTHVTSHPNNKTNINENSRSPRREIRRRKPPGWRRLAPEARARPKGSRAGRQTNGLPTRG